MRTTFHRKRLIQSVTIAIAIASVSAGRASVAQAAPAAYAAVTRTVVCEDVTGDPWTYPGPGQPGGVAYVVIVQNIACVRAQFLAIHMTAGGGGVKGWKCIRRTPFSGDCKHPLRRRHRRTLQVVAWYPDFGHPNGP